MVQPNQIVVSKKGSYHHGDLRSALIEAALVLIAEHGTRGFSLKDAAKIAGVSIAAPYRHFADKEALLQAIEDQGFGLFNNELTAAHAKGKSPQKKLEELGVAYLSFAMANPAHFQVMFGVRRRNSPTEGDQNSAGFFLLVKAIAAAYPKASAPIQKDYVLSAWSLVHGFAVLHADGSFGGKIGVKEPREQLRRVLRATILKRFGRKSLNGAG